MNQTDTSGVTNIKDWLVHDFICRRDNYCVLLHNPARQVTLAVDAPEAGAILRELEARNWPLTHLLITHHHYDHTDGNLELQEKTGCEIIGARADAARIAGVNRLVSEGEALVIGGLQIHVLATPGHTTGHVSYHIPALGLAFTGDTLFAMGCGRLFEGDAAMMWASLRKLRGLPPETRFWCGHEYTLNNAEFAAELEPDNPAVLARLEEVRALRRARRFTLPSSLASECATNPFLRADDPALAERLGMAGADPVAVFARIRQLKDRF